MSRWWGGDCRISLSMGLEAVTSLERARGFILRLSKHTDLLIFYDTHT